MILFKKATDLRNYLDVQAIKGNTIGFVPTMGALHEGHISLLEVSKKENNLTVCSVFVNPAQFNDPNDFKKYPVTIEQDIHMLESQGCDIVFMPPLLEMYPEGFAHGQQYDLGYLENILEGKYRPGHFQGVCRIVDLLLDIVHPHRLYLGQKDYQQCLVIKKLLELTNRTNIEIRICPTLREPDGLAMSSRNRRLSEDERSHAPIIFKILNEIKKDLKTGSLIKIKEKAKKDLQANGFTVDYVEIADAEDLSLMDDWNGDQKLVALMAASLNEVRLIDNLSLN